MNKKRIDWETGLFFLYRGGFMFLRFGAYASMSYLLFLYALLCILWFIVFITIYVIVKNYLKNR